jgi:hypothetical protein
VVVVVVRSKKQNSQLQHRNLYPDIERGSAESTTKQRSWKAVGFREARRRAWVAREVCLVVGSVDEGGKKPSSTKSGVAWNGTDAGKVADTELYVAVVKRTEKVLLKELDASQDQLERYLPSDGNRNSMQVALKAVKMEKGAADDQDMEATFTLCKCYRCQSVD